MQHKRMRKAVREENEGAEGSMATPARVNEESSSGSASTGDRFRGELRSKNREDTGAGRRAARGDVVKGKVYEVDVRMSEYVVRHRCAFDSICALVDELSEAQRDAKRGTVWGPVLDYKKFIMDRFLVQALIQAWNPDSSTFMIGRREVQFSIYDVTLVTGLLATGREVVFTRGDSAGEVEQVVMAAIEERLEKERQRRRGERTDSRIYRNYVAVIIALCKQYSSGDSIPMFRKLFSLLVLSGLFFARTARGCVGPDPPCGGCG